jgi:hypothetical protein
MTAKVRYGVLASLLAVVAAVALWWPSGQRKVRVAEEAPEPSALARNYPTNLEHVPAPPPPETPAERDAEIAAILAAWRDGVINKDAEVVIRLDTAFQERPERYLAALVKSSQMESNERVRAFCTRTLGKLRRPDLAPHFRSQLADKSPFVRQNAAWALGELARVHDGPEAARATVADLRRVRAKDPDTAVRAAARGALDRIE